MQVKLTLLLALVAVPVNTVFGIVAALQITRNEFWGKTLVMSMLDLPFSISPVVTGAFMLLLCPWRMSDPFQGIKCLFQGNHKGFPWASWGRLHSSLPVEVQELVCSTGNYTCTSPSGLTLAHMSSWVTSILFGSVVICCLHAGLMLVLLYGREGWFAPVIRATGFNVVFAFPGQLCAACSQIPSATSAQCRPLPWGKIVMWHAAHLGPPPITETCSSTARPLISHILSAPPA